MSGRRQFLTQVIAVSGTLVLGATRAAVSPSVSPRPLRILILGGTGNIGPHHVRAAVARGHLVSVFSRGRNHADLPPGVERLLGDRNSNLDSIKSRTWDAVVDLATFGPGWVRSLAEAIEARTGHYTFISSISVYDRPESNELTQETSRVLRYEGSTDPYAVTSEGADYGALKVLCEQEAERRFPGRTLVLRPGYIGGPDDTHGILPYWPLRMEKPGEVMAGGDPATAVQYIDVRDMAEWAVRMIERRATGTYNTLGSAMHLSQIVDAARKAAPSAREVSWVPASWLMTSKHPEMWGTLLFWEFNKGHLTQMSNARALAQGLTTRPIDVTLADSLRPYRQQTDIVTGYRPKVDHSGFEPVRVPWATYLERERETLESWRARRAEPT